IVVLLTIDSIKRIDSGIFEMIMIGIPSNRYCFSVRGSDLYPYICTYLSCTCQAFLNGCVMGNALYCKHQLAARLAYSLKKNLKVIDITDENYVTMIITD